MAGWIWGYGVKLQGMTYCKVHGALEVLLAELHRYKKEIEE